MSAQATEAVDHVVLTGDQVEALKRFARLKVGAAFMEQGMGKSRVAVELANYRAKQLDAVLWVAPYSVLATVEAETVKWGLHVPCRFVGYETLSQSDGTYLEVLDWMKGRRVCVVADESSFIKNAWSKRHERMTEIRKLAKYALALNGTPLTRDLWDLKRQMDWLSPKVLDTSDRAYRNRYFTRMSWSDGLGDERIWYEAYEPNIRHLRSLLAPYVFEARLDLGLAETDLVAEHGLSGATHLAYVERRDTFLEDWSNAPQHDQELELWKMLGDLNRMVATDSDRCASIAEEVIGSGRCLVFCQFRVEQDLIASRLPGALVMHGAIPTDERARIIDRWRESNVPLVLTYGVGAFGLNLQQAHTLHFASRSFDFGRTEQARSRIRRLGQEHALTYVTHTSGMGIEKLIDRNLTKKNVLAGLVRRELSV